MFGPDWIEKFKEGDPEIFARIHKRFHKPILRFIGDRTRGRASDDAVAEDLAQEVFLKVHRARESYEPTHDFASWVWAITRNTVIDWSRSRGAGSSELASSDDAALEDLACPTPSAESLLLKNSQRKMIIRWVRGLSRQQQRVFLLRFVRQLSYAEIARKLDISLDSVKALAFRSRRAVIAAGFLMSNSVF